MNLGELKNFLGDKPDQLSRKDAINQQLRDDAFRQISNSQSKFVSLSSTSVISTNMQIGVRVYNDSLNNNLSINGRGPNLPSPGQTEQTSDSLFDFEEVARNVLNFVGGAIKSAAANGADDAALLSMFEQAKEGVLKGIQMAEEDLAGLMNDEISDGIASSKELIELGIERLQQQIFGTDEEQAEQPVSSLSASSRISASQSESGELIIRTRDGDEVTIRFEELREFELRQQLEISATPATESVPSANAETASSQDASAATTQESTQDTTQETPETSANVQPQVDIESDEDNQADTVNEPAVTLTSEQNARFYQSSALSFSVQGELDEGELAAIGELVSEANQLAEQFFYGDVEAAFEQALELGFDRQELAGFALQLTRTEQVQVVNAYESVAHYKDDSQNTLDAAQQVRPISAYLDAMMSVVEKSSALLENGEAYENLVNGLINQLDDEVHVPDLIGAINRFHGFNKQLLNNLPASQEA